MRGIRTVAHFPSIKSNTSAMQWQEPGAVYRSGSTLYLAHIKLFRHLPSVICHLPSLLPHSPFRIPHFLAKGATHYLAPRKRGWPLSP